MTRTARPGRNGSGVFRAVLAERGSTSALTESVLEDDLLAVLRKAGLPLPTRQYRLEVPGYPPMRLDMAYAPERLALEGQSVSWHTGRESLQRDCEKHNLLVAMGWRLLQFTWRDVHHRPETVAAAVRRALFGDLTTLDVGRTPQSW